MNALVLSTQKEVNTKPQTDKRLAETINQWSNASYRNFIIANAAKAGMGVCIGYILYFINGANALMGTFISSLFFFVAWLFFDIGEDMFEKKSKLDASLLSILGLLCGTDGITALISGFMG